MAKISARGATKIATYLAPGSDTRYVLCSDGRLLRGFVGTGLTLHRRFPTGGGAADILTQADRWLGRLGYRR